MWRTKNTKFSKQHVYVLYFRVVIVTNTLVETIYYFLSLHIVHRRRLPFVCVCVVFRVEKMYFVIIVRLRLPHACAGCCSFFAFVARPRFNSLVPNLASLSAVGILIGNRTIAVRAKLNYRIQQRISI